MSSPGGMNPAVARNARVSARRSAGSVRSRFRRRSRLASSIEVRSRFTGRLKVQPRRFSTSACASSTVRSAVAGGAGCCAAGGAGACARSDARTGTGPAEEHKLSDSSSSGKVATQLFYGTGVRASGGAASAGGMLACGLQPSRSTRTSTRFRRPNSLASSQSGT